MHNNQTTKVRNRRASKFLTKRNLYQLKKDAVINPLDFVRKYGGSLTMKTKEGLYYFGFSSEKIKTHAWGCSFPAAYRELLKKFHEKLDWLNSKITS